MGHAHLPAGWSVRDVLSHVIGVEAGLLGEPVPEVDVSHLTHMRNPIAEANERVGGVHCGACPGTRCWPGWRTWRAAGWPLLDAMTQADFDAPSWTPAGRDETYGRFMRIRHYDCYLHEQDIRLALGLPARESAADLASALDEVATGLGYIVGRRAGCPRAPGCASTSPARWPAPTWSGSTAGPRWSSRSTATRPSGSSWGPCASSASPGDAHDAGTAPADGVTFTGDRALGEQLVANLAFTI